MRPAGSQGDSGKLVISRSNDAGRVISSAYLSSGNIVLSDAWRDNIGRLIDCRKASSAVGEQAQSGIAPKIANLTQFDPVLGPFSRPEAAHSAWAQSLDFLRDLGGVESSGIGLREAWLVTWCHSAIPKPNMLASFKTAQNIDAGTKTDRLIWRSKRVVNCMLYVLPMSDKLDDTTATKFWQNFLDDIIKLAAPTDTLWQSLKAGFHPLSPRALWLRAIAIACLDVVFPGLLLSEVTKKAIEHINGAIETDGTMAGGSIMATLSAAADLAMIAALPAISTTYTRTCQALITMRHDSGTLVMLGEGDGEYRELLDAIIGHRPKRARSPVLSKIGIAFAALGSTNVWLRVPVDGSNWAGLCDLEIDAAAVLTNQVHTKSGISSNVPMQVVSARSKRRDERDVVILEASAIVRIANADFNLCRELRLSHEGHRIACEDIMTCQSSPSCQPKLKVCFALPYNCQLSLAKDGCSALILLENKIAWRLRADSMIPILTPTPHSMHMGKSATSGIFLEFETEFCWQRGGFRATWVLTLEVL